MSLRNWKVTCFMSSALCGDPPMLDSLLEYELSMKLGYKNSRKLTRNTPLSEITPPPISVAKRTLAGFDIYCCSNPILGKVSAEYADKQSKRFDTDLCASMLDEKSSGKQLLTSSGPCKARFVPRRVRLVESVTWFVRCDRSRCKQLLKNIVALGTNRSYGYGTIERWEWEEIETDNSIFAMSETGDRVLMRTVPVQAADNPIGYRHSFASAFPPYWHPDTFMEVAIPY